MPAPSLPRLNKRCRVEQLIPKMNATEGVVSVEEL